jgi:hypothetical protein
MTEPTVGEIWQLREQLERDAAALLGGALFAFSRLDAHVGLMVAAILRVTGKEDQIPKVDALSFHKRLAFVESFIAESTEVETSGRAEMASWLAGAQSIRTQRNQLIHGRWDVDPYKRKILNLVGQHDSAAQQTIEYTLEDLQAFIERTRALQSQLATLRTHWGLP